MQKARNVCSSGLFSWLAQDRAGHIEHRSIVGVGDVCTAAAFAKPRMIRLARLTVFPKNQSSSQYVVNLHYDPDSHAILHANMLNSYQFSASFLLEFC